MLLPVAVVAADIGRGINEYYRGMHGFILVFDLGSQADPVTQLTSWLDDVNLHGAREQGARGARQIDQLCVVIVGNKCGTISLGCLGRTDRR